MSTLQIIDLHVSIDTEQGSKEILKGVTLTINSGETHAIMGPNGSGSQRLPTRSRDTPATRSIRARSCSTEKTCSR